MLFSMFTVHREAFSPANFFILTRCFSLVNIFFLLFVHFSFHSPDSSDGRSLCLRAWSSLQRTFIYYHRSASLSIVFSLQLIFSELQFADKERSRTSFRLYCYQYNHKWDFYYISVNSICQYDKHILTHYRNRFLRYSSPWAPVDIRNFRPIFPRAVSSTSSSYVWIKIEDMPYQRHAFPHFSISVFLLFFLLRAVCARSAKDLP